MEELKGQSSNFVGVYAKVYALSDQNGDVFYIGCTLNSVAVRASQHVNEAKNPHRGHNKLKVQKIKSLNYCFVVTIIDMVWITGTNKLSMKSKTKELEYAWIKKYRKLGYNLTNRFPIVPSDKKLLSIEKVGQSFQVMEDRINEILTKDHETIKTA